MAGDPPTPSQPDTADVPGVDPAGPADRTEPASAPAETPPKPQERDDDVWAISLEQLIRRSLLAAIVFFVILAIWSMLAPPKSLYVISGSTTRIQTVLSDDRSWAPPMRFDGVFIRYNNTFIADCFKGSYQPAPGTAIELLIGSGGAMIVTLIPAGFDVSVPDSGTSVGTFNWRLGSDASAVEEFYAKVAANSDLAQGETSIEQNNGADCRLSQSDVVARPGDAFGFATPQEPFPIDGMTRIGRATSESLMVGSFIGRDHQSVLGQIELYATSIACPIRRFLQTNGCPLNRVLADPMTIPAGATLIPQNPLNPIKRFLNVFGADIAEDPAVTLGEVAIEDGLISFSVSVSAVDLIIAPPAFGTDFERSYRLNAGLLQQLAAEPAFQVLFSIILTLLSIIVLFSSEDDKRTKVKLALIAVKRPGKSLMRYNLKVARRKFFAPPEEPQDDAWRGHSGGN